MDYTQITPVEREEMLAAIGVSSIADLFGPIPKSDRFDRELCLPPAAPELDVQRELTALSERNLGAHSHACFMGGGAYDHFIPVLVDSIAGRGEFLTAYTPYQAEASQGALQVFFEFQTQIARLSGMDIANASLYDGATAVAEAVMMALSASGKRRILLADTIHPDYRRVVMSYVEELPVEVVCLESAGGRVDVATVTAQMSDEVACVVIQSPNFYGLIEDWQGCFTAAHERAGTLAVAVFNPIACGLLRNPGACGADIAVGEGQPLGTPMQFGGPGLGLFAARRSLMRKMPGRLVGWTTDIEGRDAYCLVLQTREQHIRREKATSNICTNQGLLALRASIFLNAMGPQGLAEMAEQSYHKTHYLAREVCAIDGFRLKHDSEAPFFHEFVVCCPVAARRVMSAGRDAGLLLGPALDSRQVAGMGQSDELLLCATEKRTREELDAVVELLKQFRT